MAVFMMIDGMEMPTPTSCPINEEDLDSPQSGRSESGDMHRERVRTKVLMIQPEWSGVTHEQAVLLREALLPCFFTVTLRVPWGTVTRKMYAGDLNWTPAFLRDGTARWDLSVQLTEK